MIIQFLTVFLLVGISSILLVKLSKELACRFNLFMDKPNLRSSHTKAVPRCGGISIALVFLCAMLFFVDFQTPYIKAYLMGAVLISLIGILDDFINLKGHYKILGMLASALVPILFGVKLEYLSIVMNNPLLLNVLTLVWIYGMINAFNFMDGIDGLIGGLSVILSLFIMVLALINGNNFAAFGSLTLTAICLGFLLFNYSPASVFLGDTGSMFLGYNFALLSISIINRSSGKISIYVFLLLFAIIIFDTMSTFIRRGLEGKNVIEAHREHLYQQLNILGFTHARVSLIYYTISILLGILSIFFLFSILVVKILILFFALCLLVLFDAIVRSKEPVS